MASKLTERVWLWAAVHHPEFHKCSITFYRPPISIGIHFAKWIDELLVVRLALNIPKIALVIPYRIVNDFVKAKALEGEIIDVDSIINDIPF